MSFKSEGCEALCLPNLLAGGLPAGALAASIASHTLQISNTKHTHASNNICFIFKNKKHNTAHTKTRTNDGGLRPHFVGSVSFCCVVFEACVCFVFEVCVGVVPRVCEAMEAASAPASKPPAKRLGKHRASHPSDLNDILKNSTLFSR